MKKNISIVFFLCSVFVGTSFAQCEADYTVIVNNFEFIPSDKASNNVIIV